MNERAVSILLVVLAMLAWLAVGYSIDAFGQQTPTPVRTPTFTTITGAMPAPTGLPFVIVGGDGAERTCGRFERSGGAWVHVGCTSLYDYLAAQVEVKCLTTGQRVVFECPGGETKVQTVPR